MRKVIFLALGLGSLGAGGCSALPGLLGAPTPTVGWRVEFGTPSTLTVPATAVVQQGSGTVSTTPPLAALAVPAVTAALAAAPPASPCIPTTATPRTVLAAAPEPCDMQTVCRKLDDIARRLPEPPHQMPAGKEE